MMRRTFIAGLGSTAAWPAVTRAQQPAPPVVGLLFTPTPAAEQRLRKVHQGLAEMGFVDGRNVNVSLRWAEDQPERRPAQFAEMIRRNAAVIR
jgi:putative ABC transport system substrate-binding protein